MNQKLVSFELKADFGFIRKPDNNDGLMLSYNMLHKPALLGILGAIVGLKGYGHDKEDGTLFKCGDLPEYYTQLQHLLIGIAPLRHDKGNFAKTTLKYNNATGFANVDDTKKNGATLNLFETMLIRPAYHCFVLLNLDNLIEQQLYDNLLRGYAEFLPYIGKNEFSAWWENFQEHAFENEVKASTIDMKTIFLKEGQTMNKKKQKPKITFKSDKVERFMYFERLPIGFDEKLMQYNLAEFVYTTFSLTNDSEISNLMYLPNEKYCVQVI